MSWLKRAEKRNGKYQNPVPTSVGGLRTMWKVLPLYVSNREETEPREPLGPFVTDPRVYDTPPASGLRVTWFGHSSLLLEIDGLRVLIDPVWERRASPVQFAGPARFYPPTLALGDLPELDCVLVSHDHYDHFGASTLRQLARSKAASRALWVTSAGVGRRLEKLGVEQRRIAALDWLESAAVQGGSDDAGLRVTALPARHFSGRSLWDRFSTLWSSFVLEGPRHRVFFGADSGYWEGFREIGEQYGPFDLTMLEIGAFHPLWADIHMGPEGAARAYEAMGGPERCGPLFPVHWALFNLALHGWRQPMEEMCRLASERGIPLWYPAPGAPAEVVRGNLVQVPWWQKP